MLVQYEVGGNACEYGFEGEKDGGVGGWEVLLGPALDGERGGGGEEAGNAESYDKPGSDRQMRFSASGQRDCHDEGGYADLESCELAGWHSVRGVGEGQKVSGEGYGAG